eukprot:CAMPEP_0175794524 /NCGR_PEP_ID=MMETSP0097-20121207/84011_1 /TAXON_ID=311494 /ORGANISM="Alexandrium monilatum, Strain CCMP3105" /LENGTH=184 /DNA_ID=CAMNT_0017105715 /DNA_START=124 /DNA_END=675 /DNA_ORIENTATION=+
MPAQTARLCWLKAAPAAAAGSDEVVLARVHALPVGARHHARGAEALGQRGEALLGEAGRQGPGVGQAEEALAGVRGEELHLAQPLPQARVVVQRIQEARHEAVDALRGVGALAEGHRNAGLGVEDLVGQPAVLQAVEAVLHAVPVVERQRARPPGARPAGAPPAVRGRRPPSPQAAPRRPRGPG